MLRAIQTGASGLTAAAHGLGVLANNVANVNTHGFKGRQVVFAELVNQELRQADLPVRPEDPPRIGQGTAATMDYVDFGSGNLILTGRDLDLAIAGSGFFALELPSGELILTRDGSFQPGPGGTIVHAVSGYPLYPAVKIPADAASVKVTPTGQVKAIMPDGKETVLGQIQLYQVTNPDYLQPAGHNFFRLAGGVIQAKTADPGTEGAGIIRAGFVEASNVDLGMEMARVIIMSRAYQIAARSVSISDEMWGLANNIWR
ncbi:MAG: flagellar hook-basal body protein [Clostridia bacterium]|nr:MAG: flagellar hook-basal body protein [Clostridia bacterium]